MSFISNLAYLATIVKNPLTRKKNQKILLEINTSSTRNYLVKVLQIKDKTESSIMCFIEDHLRIDFIFIDCISFIFHFIFLLFFRAVIYLWHL